jgi:nickel transport protein
MVRSLKENVDLLRYSHSSSLRTSGKGTEAGYFTRSRLMGIAGSIILFLLCFSVPAFAHRVYLYAWVEGNTVYTESYFSGGMKVKNGLIEVFDAAGKKLVEGRTNDKGEFSFRIPEKTDLRIVINASMGHRGEYTVKADELGGTSPPETEKEQALKATKTESRSPVQIDTDQIRKIVEEALDSRLKPIAQSIARLQEKKGPGLTEVVGGIGYIFGIMGLLFYFKGRKK